MNSTGSVRPCDRNDRIHPEHCCRKKRKRREEDEGVLVPHGSCRDRTAQPSPACLEA